MGATFSRGFSRALGSLSAGIIAVAVIHVAICTSHAIESVLVGLSIFVIGALTSFLRLWPSLAQYEQGFRVALISFCLITVSGFRMGNPMKTAVARFYCMTVGGLVTLTVSVLIFPIWAGGQLHKELVQSFDSVADSVEECVNKYLMDDNHQEFFMKVNDEFEDEPAFKKCRETLHSSEKLDSLAISAKWEPPHGKFQHSFYPWLEYVKVGAILQHCAYEVMALHGVLHSEIQAPYKLRMSFQSEIQDVSSKAAQLVRSLGKDISNMRRSPLNSLLKSVHDSTECLQHSLDIHFYLLTSHSSLHSPTLLPLELSAALSNFSSSSVKLTSNQKPPQNTHQQNTPSVTLGLAECYHKTMKKSQRLHSWPSIEINMFEEGATGSEQNIPKIRVLQSIEALSLATFTSLLIEFVARLDHLVDAVNEIARKAKFKHEGVN